MSTTEGYAVGPYSETVVVTLKEPSGFQVAKVFLAVGQSYTFFGDPGLKVSVRRVRRRGQFTEAQRLAAVARVDRGEDIDWSPEAPKAKRARRA